MKHEYLSTTTANTVDCEGDTADLQRCLWLSAVTPATRRATVTSLRAFRNAASGERELTVTEVRRLLAEADPALKARIGKRWIPVASDVRRALRVWDDLPVRWLALSLRHRVPTFADAATAVGLRLKGTEAKRVLSALEALARSQDGALEDIPAALATVEPLLRAATPETFDVAAMKSLDNKRTLVRNAVRLVDPLASGARETDVSVLPAVWREALERMPLKDHEKSMLAILRRLARFSAGYGAVPASLTDAMVEAFARQELETHSPVYTEKIRSAFRRWNGAVDAGLPASRLSLPAAPVYRQAEVKWDAVPPAIRDPLDAYLATAVSVRSLGDWGTLVPDQDDEYAELGIPRLDLAEEAEQPGAPLLESGTRENWRNAVKRAWYAAVHDPKVSPDPVCITDLFGVPVATALVAGVRKARRARLESRGQTFDPTTRGRYEHTLVEALCSVGRALQIDPEQLEPIEELKRSIDPLVVGLKRTKEGGVKRIYADRRIGPRHARMLAAFSDPSQLRRWFEAPSVLWALACKPIAAGRRPTISHVALARSALIARIGQYVVPARRANFARLRHDGDNRHLLLPSGEREGTLRIPANEGKTLREIHVQIDPETVRMLKYYIKNFLPVARDHAGAEKGNPHLFPGAGGKEVQDGGYASGFGYHTKTKLNGTFKKHLKKYCGLNLCMHVMRHLAGKIIVDQDPSAMSLVQEILGHKTVKTTQAYYAEVSKLVAQRRYVHLLEKQSRRVLATVKFVFVDPRTGEVI